MNCLDYRRVLLTGDGETEAMRQHRLQCAHCAPLFREHGAMENDLRRALEVAVPEGFTERLAESLATQRPVASAQRTGRRRFLAAAAVGAGAIGLGLYAWIGRDDPMAMASIDFVIKEEAKSIMMGAMPRAEAESRLADSLPLASIERIGQIRHISPCPFGGGMAYHVVLMTPQDKVTLLIMPDSSRRSRASASHDGLYASVVPLRKGSVGVVGMSAAVVDSVVGAIQA